MLSNITMPALVQKALQGQGRCAPSFTRATVRGLAKLRQDQLDAAIAEMNQEMSDLFGEPMASSGLGDGPSQVNFSERMVASKSAEDSVISTPTSLPNAPRVVPPAATDAARALYSHIAACSAELQALGTEAADLDRGLRLSANIGEAARAVQAVQALGNASV